jgi:hypothetical protein
MAAVMQRACAAEKLNLSSALDLPRISWLWMDNFGELRSCFETVVTQKRLNLTKPFGNVEQYLNVSLAGRSTSTLNFSNDGCKSLARATLACPYS